MKSWRRIALVSIVLAVASPLSASAQTDPLEEPVGSERIVNAWAVAPVGPGTDPLQPSERPFLSYSVVPGQVIHDAVTLFNYSNVPLTFRLLAADAFNNEEGAFDVPPSDSKPKHVGSWVKLDQENLALPPKSQATVPITLTVPARVAPGDHAGAIMASSAAVGSGPDGRSVNIDRRTGTRMYIRVAGKLRPELALSNVESTYRPSLNPLGGTVDVTYTVTNAGNVRLGGSRKVSTSGLLGLGKKSSKAAKLPELLPGQHVTLRETFEGIPATMLASSEISVNPDDSGAADAVAVSRTAMMLAVPWTVVALGLIGALLSFARRSYRQHQRDVVPAL